MKGLGLAFTFEKVFPAALTPGLKRFSDEWAFDVGARKRQLNVLAKNQKR
jgi:hypothetical protein